MNKSQYYYCALGNTARLSTKVSTPEDAAKYCFGITGRVTCLPLGGKSPKALTRAFMGQKYAELVALHSKNTGNVLK